MNVRRKDSRWPGFVAFWCAETVSEAGSYVTTLALQVLVVVTLSGTAFDLGLVNAARWLPYALLGLLVGALLERRRRKPLLIATDLLRAGLLLTVPILWWIEALNLPALLLVLSVFGAISLVNDTATQSYLPRLVPRRSLVTANARLDQSAAAAQVAGPAAGGGVVALVSAPFALIVSAVAFIVSASLTATVRVEEPLESRAGRRSWAVLRHEISEGLRFTYHHRELGPLAMGTHAWFLFNSMLATAFASFALAVVGLDPATFGLVLAAGGAGALVGATWSIRVGRRLGPGGAIIGGHLVMAIGWALVAVAAWCPPVGDTGTAIALMIAGQAVIGLAMGVQNANEMGFRHATAPDSMQGRMNATLRSTNRALIIVGAPLGGLLTDALGAGVVFAIGITGILIVAGYLASTPMRGARHPEQRQ